MVNALSSYYNNYNNYSNLYSLAANQAQSTQNNLYVADNNMQANCCYYPNNNDNGTGVMMQAMMSMMCMMMQTMMSLFQSQIQPSVEPESEDTQQKAGIADSLSQLVLAQQNLPADSEGYAALEEIVQNKVEEYKSLPETEPFEGQNLTTNEKKANLAYAMVELISQRDDLDPDGDGYAVLNEKIASIAEICQGLN